MDKPQGPTLLKGIRSPVFPEKRLFFKRFAASAANRLSAARQDNETNPVTTRSFLKRCGFRLPKADGLLALFQSLREQYVDNEAAVLSLLEEARYFVGKFNLALAQQRLIELADTYPQSPQAGIALYEAAVIADKRASEATRKQALEILSERLIGKRPGDPLIFYARLLQGEILRNLNEFAAAQQLYENILREFPDHREIHLVELARSRSLLGQSIRDPARLRNAAAGMERLFDLPDLPVDVRVEAGYSWAVILKQLDEPRRSREVLWLVISRFLRDPQSSAQLGSNGRYWMARTVFELGNMLDGEGKTSDAREVYQLILSYELPGRNLALSRFD